MHRTGTATLQWLVGLFCAVIGTLMLVAPHQFTAAAYSALKPHLPLWGAFFLRWWFVEAVRSISLDIPDNEFVIFGNSSHCTILEKEADVYLDVIRSFLRRRGAVASAVISRPSRKKPVFMRIATGWRPRWQ